MCVDPLFKSYPWYTPYQFAGNKPIRYIDLDGLEEAEPQQHDGTTKMKVEDNTSVWKRMTYDSFWEQTVPNQIGRIWNKVTSWSLEGDSKQSGLGVKSYGSGTTDQDPKYEAAPGTRIGVLEEELVEGLGKQNTGAQVRSKWDHSSGDGRGSGNQGGTDWKNLESVTETVKGGAETVTGRDTYTPAKEYQVQESGMPEYTYSEKRSQPRFGQPDTVIHYRTNNTTGERDSTVTIIP